MDGFGDHRGNREFESQITTFYVQSASPFAE